MQHNCVLNSNKTRLKNTYNILNFQVDQRQKDELLHSICDNNLACIQKLTVAVIWGCGRVYGRNMIFETDDSLA